MARSKKRSLGLGKKAETMGYIGNILSIFNVHNIITCKSDDDSFFCRLSRFFSGFIMMSILIMVSILILFVIYKFTSKSKIFKTKINIFKKR